MKALIGRDMRVREVDGNLCVVSKNTGRVIFGLEECGLRLVAGADDVVRVEVSFIATEPEAPQ